MRPIHTLPLVAAILLASCGGDDQAADGEALTGDQVAAEAGDMVQPRPGQYRTTAELIEFDVPNAPAGMADQLKAAFAGGLAEANTFCMTDEDAAENGPRKMVEDLAEGDCTMNTFNVSGGSVVADMQCAHDGGTPSRIKMEGEMGAERSTMTMDMTQQIAGAGDVHMKMRMNSQRIGECAA